METSTPPILSGNNSRQGTFLSEYYKSSIDVFGRRADWKELLSNLELKNEMKRQKIHKTDVSRSFELKMFASLADSSFLPNLHFRN